MTGWLARARGWASERLTGRAAILMYHRVAEVDADPWGMCVSPANFAEHLAVLRARATPIPLARLDRGAARSAVPRRGVVVTFDDGYVDALDAAHPLLHAHDVPATLFVSTGNVGRAGEFWWDELEHLLLRPVALPPALQLTSATAARRWELGPAAEYDARTHEHTRHLHVFDAPAGTRQAFYYAVWQWLFPIAHEERQRLLGEIARWAGVERAPRASFRTLRPDEIRAVADGGLVEIGAHTVTHPPLALHSVEAQRREIVGSRDTLREILGRPVTSFSYPHGEHSTDTVGLVRDAGFVRACTVESGRVHARSDPLRLPRFTVQDWTGEELERRLSSWLGG